MRDMYKEFTVEIDGEEMRLRIKRMSVWDGSALLKFLVEKCMPTIQKMVDTYKSDDLSEDATDEEKAAKAEEENRRIIMQMVPELLSTITSEDLRELMLMCLKTCECDKPAGWQHVVDKKGNFGIPEIEYDTIAGIKICYQVIAFNCGGFFGESGLGGLLGK